MFPELGAGLKASAIIFSTGQFSTDHALADHHRDVQEASYTECIGKQQLHDAVREAALGSGFALGAATSAMPRDPPSSRGRSSRHRDSRVFPRATASAPPSESSRRGRPEVAFGGLCYSAQRSRLNTGGRFAGLVPFSTKNSTWSQPGSAFPPASRNWPGLHPPGPPRPVAGCRRQHRRELGRVLARQAVRETNRQLLRGVRRQVVEQKGLPPGPENCGSPIFRVPK